MASLELEGKIQQKLAIQKGQAARGPWSKQDFILEYMDGSFPASVCFTAFGDDKVGELSKYNVGDSVKVSFNLRAREYNGRWYNDIRVWRITPSGAAQASPSQNSMPQPPAPSINDMMVSEDDSQDLPF